ncbi:MAG TPA: hypothetical protein VFF20_04995 [Pseudogracilibacillus sp.]|nr:hypothetical protein [Pseudogracilibacillus sp.]
MLLQEGIKNNYVIPTEYTRKLTIDGHTDSYQVYKIRLDQLYYNDQNDRIATWISKYKADKNIDKVDVHDTHYNDVIEQFIYESNPKAIEKTKNNIDLTGQREPGVVLNDGRVVDGNRRFTCLRKLEKENAETQYFEAVILERDIDNSEKEIKLLELYIQHGEEGKIDYNPIDKLVGLYKDVVKNNLITIDEYCKSTNESKASVNKKIEQAKLMVEFLEFINAEEQFYIARDLELDGPLGEIPSILNKAKTDDEKEDLKLIIFSNLAMKPQGDVTRFVRKMKHIVDSEHHGEFIEEQMGYVEKTAEKIEGVPEINSKFINQQLRTDDDLKQAMKLSVEKYELKAKKDTTKLKPIEDLRKCKIIIESVDKRIVDTFDVDEKEQLEQLITESKDLLEALSSELKEKNIL